MSAGSSQYIANGRSWNKKVGFSLFIFLIRFYYALEWLSDAGSAPIRTALRFCFDIYVRFFSQLFFKNIFWSIEKKNFEKKRKHIWSEKKIGGKKNVRPKNIFWPIFFWLEFIVVKFLDFSVFIFRKFLFFENIIFQKKSIKNLKVKDEAKFHCGSNGSTLSL